PPAFVVRLVNAVVLPTAPVSVVVPVLLSASVCAPFTAPVNVIAAAPAFTVVAPASVLVPAAVKPASLYVPERVVLSLNAVAPVVPTPTDEDVPPASVVSVPKAVAPPTMALKVVAPVEFTVRPCAPATVAFTVPVNVTPPVP